MHYILPILITLHFAYHLVATVGVAYGLYHSDSVHSHSKWKIFLALLWLLVSIGMIVGVLDPDALQRCT
jgi:hypothetical protein